MATGSETTTSMTPTPGAADRLRRASDWLARSLFDGDAPAVRWYTALSIFAVATVLAFLRLGSAAWHARVWAEDGSIFLQQTITQGPLSAFTTTYAGYLHSVPRSVAAVVQLMPVRYWGIGVHASAAVVVGVLVTIAYAALGNLVPSRWVRLLLAGYIALVPVGPEVTDSIANLQWYVLPVAILALLWTPRTRVGWVAVGVLVFAATTTSPLGGIVLLVALVRLLVQRCRPALGLAAVAAVGFAIQTTAMIVGPPRTFPPGDPGSPRLLAHGYVSRVAGDSVLGIARSLPAGIARSAIPGLVVLAVLAVVTTLVLILRRGRVPWLPALGLLVLSVGTYLSAAVTLRFDFTSTLLAGRYYVIPAILFVTAAVVVLAGARRTVDADRDSVARRFAALQFDRVVAVVGGLLLVFTLVTNYQVGDIRGRNKGATWGRAVHVGRHLCTADPGLASYSVLIQPGRSFVVVLPCSLLRGR